MPDYATLVAPKSTEGSIAYFVNTDKFSATTALEEAEAFIFQDLWVKEMRAVTQNTLTASSDELSPPSGFVAPLALNLIYQSGVHKIRLVDPEQLEFRRRYNNVTLESDQPCFFTYMDEKLIFDVNADQAYTYRLVSMNESTRLSGTNTTSFLTQKFPDILRAAAVAKANEQLKNNAERDHWLKMSAVLIERANVKSDLAYSGLEVDFDTGY